MVDGVPTPYRVERRLGSGGMADVYLVRNEGLGRLEALKLLSPRFLADRGLSERFLNEARIAAGLRHPHIAAVYAVSDPSAARPFFSMQYVAGGDLADRLADGGPMPIEDACALLVQIAAALDYAHSRGVVHRDVKPANVLLEGQGHDGCAFVVDFGIARAQEADPSSRLTRAGMIVGTPEYMSPEQAGAGGEVGPASDQYSLAIVAYEMLCGRVPFPLGGGASEMGVLMAQAKDPPPAPSSLRPDLPHQMARALLKGLAKRPEERHPSCQAFVAALAAPEPKVAPAAGRPWPLVAALGAAGAALVGYALLRRPEPAPVPVEPPVVAPPAPPALTFVSVPSVTGHSTEEAQQALKDAGLASVVTTARSETTPAGRIDRQEPASGSSQPPGSVVRLVSSLGPEPPAPTPAIAPAVPPPADDQQALRAKLAAWRDAWAGNRIDEYLAHYDPSARITSSNGSPRSFTDWSAAQRRHFADPGRLTIEVLPTDVHVEGDTAVLTFDERFNRVGGYGGSFRSHVQDVWRLCRTTGGWAITDDHSTAIPDDPANAAGNRSADDLFSIGTPTGWSVEDKPGKGHFVRTMFAPDRSISIKVDVSVPASGGAALDNWKSMDRNYRGKRAYTLLRLEPCAVGGQDGAVWEFEHVPFKGAPRYRKRDLGVAYAGRGYAVLFSAPVTSFPAYESVFERTASTFALK